MSTPLWAAGPSYEVSEFELGAIVQKDKVYKHHGQKRYKVVKVASDPKTGGMLWKVGIKKKTWISKVCYDDAIRDETLCARTKNVETFLKMMARAKQKGNIKVYQRRKGKGAFEPVELADF